MIGNVLKYPINKIGEVITIIMPTKLAICDIGVQNGDIFLWALVDKFTPLRSYQFIVFGTGWEIEEVEKLTFLKTVHMKDGLIWHVFEIQE